MLFTFKAMNTSASPSIVIHAPILNSPVWKKSRCFRLRNGAALLTYEREKISPLKRKVGNVLEKKKGV